jgi:hypothetical protein
LLVVPPLAALEPALLVEPPPLPALGLPSRPAVAPATPDGLGFDEPLEQATANTAKHGKPTNLEKFMNCSGN